MGFRSLCDNYEDVLKLREYQKFRVADMTKGKSNDDGYCGVHLYFQLDGSHYPIEIQYNTYYDRQFNNWLHKYIYKKNYESSVMNFGLTYFHMTGNIILKTGNLSVCQAAK